VFAGVRGSNRPAQAGPPTAEEAKAQRADRQRPAAEIAPKPIAEQVPIVGPEGFDADGYPRQYVDRAAVRGMLRLRRYAELTKMFESTQAKFEENPRYEYWPEEAMLSFRSAEADLGPLLDSWAQTSPTSFAPFVARGSYLNAVGWARRGGKYANETHDSNFAEMHATHARALVDLDKALLLCPKLVAALREKLSVYRATSATEDLATTAMKALTICPACMSIRVMWIDSLTPRWGGTYESMDAVAKSAKVSRNPRLRFLRGYVDADQAELLLHDKKLDEALVAINRACALGDYEAFLEQRSRIYRAKKQLPEARRDIDRALDLQPSSPKLLMTRAYLRNDQKEYEGSARDLIAALRIEPTVHGARELRQPAVAGLMYEAGQHHQQKRPADALRVVEMAIELDPDNRAAHEAKNFYMVNRDVPTAPGLDEIATARAAASAAPDDLKLRQRLDYLLAQQRRFPEVIEMWNEFLAHHPDNGTAFMERAGAHWNAGHRTEAAEDAQKACDLGISEGCVRAKQARGH